MAEWVCYVYINARKWNAWEFMAQQHELGHSWFQHILASNESKHPWMDEGLQPIFLILQKMNFQIKK
jgi:hypothetical protein